MAEERDEVYGTIPLDPENQIIDGAHRLGAAFVAPEERRPIAMDGPMLLDHKLYDQWKAWNESDD